MKKYYITCVILFGFYFSYSQDWRNLQLEAGLFENEFGVLDPLFLNFTLNYNAEGKIENINIFDIGLYISYKSVEDKQWEELEFYRMTFPDFAPYKMDFPFGNQAYSMHLTLFPRLSKNTFSAIEKEYIQPEDWERYEMAFDKSFKAGKYLLRLTYFPCEIENDSLFTTSGEYQCTKCIETILPFEVKEYEKPEDKAAFEWLNQKKEPNLCYKIDDGIYRNPTYSKEEQIEYLEQFIGLFPDSKFAPYAAIKLMRLYNPRGIEDVEKKFQKYSRIGELCQFVKQHAENPVLLLGLEVDIKRVDSNLKYLGS